MLLRISSDAVMAQVCQFNGGDRGRTSAKPKVAEIRSLCFVAVSDFLLGVARDGKVEEQALQGRHFSAIQCSNGLLATLRPTRDQG